jgi:hypothetical protein
MNNKPDPTLLRPSNLSNEIKKRVPKSRETIPLNLKLRRQSEAIARARHTNNKGSQSKLSPHEYIVFYKS